MNTYFILRDFSFNYRLYFLEKKTNNISSIWIL